MYPDGGIHTVLSRFFPYVHYFTVFPVKLTSVVHAYTITYVQQMLNEDACRVCVYNSVQCPRTRYCPSANSLQFTSLFLYNVHSSLSECTSRTCMYSSIPVPVCKLIGDFHVYTLIQCSCQSCNTMYNISTSTTSVHSTLL